MRREHHLACVLVAMTLSTGLAQTSSHSVYRIDADRSRIEIGVFRGGLLKPFGHDHTIAARKFHGTVQFDARRTTESSVSVIVEAGSLTVVDPHVSEEERMDVQSTMEGIKVLDVKAFPRIAFVSTRVSNVLQTGDDFALTLTGKLNLHGVEKEISFPLHVRFQQKVLRATGTASVAQTDFNIKPIKLGGGTIRVKDRVNVTFDFVAVGANP